MRYNSSYSILSIAFVASIICIGNLSHATNEVFAQYQKDSYLYEDNSYPHPSYPVLHKITLGVEEIPLIGGNLYAYKMIKHELYDINNPSKLMSDITDRYASGPTIPGPSIIIEEGDMISLTLKNPQDGGAPGMVSVHVHGIHYPITSDGTLVDVNKIGDQGVEPGDSITYSWTAGPGTAGTWPYHDHTLGLNSEGKDPNGLEMSGLFGTLIIDSSKGYTTALIDEEPKIVYLKDISKDVICWVTDDAFWCDEIVNSKTYEHIALWENPTIKAKAGELIRFHLYSIGTDFTKFELTGYEWLKPGTDEIVQSQTFGPLESLVFTIQANDGDAEYRDIIQSHLKSGMFGDFIVDNSGISIPGDNPLTL